MGLSIDKEVFEKQDYALFAGRLQQSLSILHELLGRPGFGNGPLSLGAELELPIIDQHGQAFPINRSLLAQSADSSLQLELDRFNIEYNTTPLPLSGSPFTALETQLTNALDTINNLAASQGGRVVPIGILPTLTEADLQPQALTDLPRYRALSWALRQQRHAPFRVCIDGKEPLTLACNDVTLEGANTSLQLHLRVPPTEFANMYNMAQLVTPIAVAVSANSPIFVGHQLWDETRIALFKQAIDYRPPHQKDWSQPARVSYGNGWIRDGAYELFAEAVGLFPPLLPLLSEHAPMDSYQRGELPALEELRLHQGTVWRWNRAIYDPAMGGHLRIELRTLPSGPTPIDMAANAAFLYGMILGLQTQAQHLLPIFPFDYAHRNFYRAAQVGLHAKLLWPSNSPPSPSEVPVRELARTMLPLAKQGLLHAGVDQGETERMLGIIQQRVDTGINGATWQRSMLTKFEQRMSRREALAAMLEKYLTHANEGRPVTEWEPCP
ncbi:hypothetical protein [Candidatus Nitronereus thalassa]|uniref:Glutamate--cysteine ligase n=1 Tax=Candidatus Nitronereus thalassa TaxID=3020898 RepID=A0ABU3KC59_9BACT|nr:hypothetical protein [Candidatus Nitronereus thalassa]MDT7044017.1 hypothetical protein [Candidatus Nitronereus thalassa]